jgi:hypothetical protein
VYGVAPGDLATVATQARERNAAVVTITTAGTVGYPWSTLPEPAEWGQVLTAVTGTPFAPVPIAPPIVRTQQIASVNYFDDAAAWARSRALGPTARYVIVNPASGPGPVPIPQVATEVDAARAVGQQPLGYVHTLWGARSPAQVLDDARLYRSRYGIGAVFLDEAAHTCDAAPYYAALAATLRADGFTTIVLNPGQAVPECYAFADGIVTFEGSRADYPAWQPMAWMQRYPAERFWHLVNDVPAASIGAVVGASKTKWAGVVFTTDDAIGDGNPWDEYPQTPYLDAVRASVVAAPRTEAPSAGGSAPPGRSPAPRSAALPVPADAPPPPTGAAPLIGYVGPVRPLPPEPAGHAPTTTAPSRTSGAVLEDAPLVTSSGADEPSALASPRVAAPAADVADEAIVGERAARTWARRHATVLGVQVTTPPARLALSRRSPFGAVHAAVMRAVRVLGTASRA